MLQRVEYLQVDFIQLGDRHFMLKNCARTV
jgi:hypothetical protein